MKAHISGVVSLWELQEFYADVITKFLSELSAWEVLAFQEERERLANPSITAGLCARLEVLQGLANMYGLNASDQQCRRIRENCEAKGMHVSCGEMRDDLRELRRRFEDDFKEVLLFKMTSQEAEQYKNPTKDWETVATRFWKVKFNIEESGKCFAFQRYGAAVFHVLQVAEFGVVQIADLMNVSGDKPGWGSLKRLSSIADKPYQNCSDLEKKHHKFLKDVVPLAVIVRDNWRHKLDHVDNQIIWVEDDFSAQVAAQIISATCAFMTKLVRELPNKDKA